MAIELNQNFGEKKKTEPEERPKQKKVLDFFKRFRSISLREKIFFVQNLRIMIKGGLSLGTALETVSVQLSNKYFKEIIADVSKQVDAGVTFSQALERYPKVFNELFVNMIRSGEMSGSLESVMERLHIQMKRDHDLIAKVKGAMVYPLVVVVAMLGIGTAMIVFVVPKLIAIFEEFNTKLPLPTRIMIGISKFVTQNGLLVILVLVVFVVVFVKFYRSEAGKNIFHKIFLKMPVFSTIVKKINLARFCRTSSSLLKTDIPIVQSLKITSLVAGNVYYKRALTDASQKIAKGLQINKVLSDYPKLFPPTVIQMLKVGEESGAVDEVLDEVAQFYEEDLNQVMESLPALIEPLLILILGFGVGGMAIAIIMPMYSLTQAF